MADNTNSTFNIIDTNSKTNVMIANLTVNGNYTNQGSGYPTSIYLSGSYSKIDKCWITGVGSNWFGIVAGASNSIVSNCNFYGNHWNSVSLHLGGNNDTAEGNVFNSSGIYEQNSYNNTISGNSFNSANLVTWNSTYTSITGNNFNGGDIYLRSLSNNNTITGNSIYNYGWYGINLENSSYNTISSNALKNNTTAEIYLNSTSTYNIVEGNNIQTTTNYGIREAAAADNYNAIHNNTIIGATTAAIYALGPHTTVAGNKTSSATEGIFDIQAQANATQTALTVTQSGTGAIVDLTNTASSTSAALTLTNLGSGNSFVVNDEATDTTPFVIDASGNVGVGTNAPLSTLDVRGTIENGLVAWWSMDEGTGTTIADQSINSNTGTLGGDGLGTDLPSWTNGKFGKALSFDGSDDYVDAGSGSSLDVTGNITIEAWIYPTSLPANWKAMVWKSNNYYLATHGDEIDFGFYSGGWLGGETTTANLVINNWYHIVGVLDDANDKEKIYVNGVEKLDKTQTSSMTTADTSLWIGKSIYAGEFFNGSIDEVRIYNRALSEREVAEHYRQQAPSMAQGGTISDSSAYTALTVQQSSTGNIVDFKDGATSVFKIADSGNITASEFNNIIYVDGTKYTADSPGIQNAIDDLPSTGGKVVIPEGTYNVDRAMDACVADDGGSYTTQTTACNDAATSDITLLPAVPTVNDAYYFGYDYRTRKVTVNIGTPGAGTWTITWEYYNGSTWASLASVSDGTTGFTAAAGERDVTYTLPTNWVQTSVNSITKYWVRARVSAYTSITTQPKGTQAYGKGSIVIDKSYVALEGVGDASKLFLANSANVTVIEVGNGSTAYSNITISNLQVDGNSGNQTAGSSAIYFNTNITKSKIDKIYVYNFRSGSYVFYLLSSSNNLLSGNIITNTGGANSYNLFLSSSSYNTITGNNFQNGNDGILLSVSTSNIIAKNQISNTGSGIFLSSSSNNNLIEGNDIYSCSDGLDVDNSALNTINDNNIHNNTGNGVIFGWANTQSNYNSVTNNIISTNNNHGLKINAGKYNTITSNIFRNNSNGNNNTYNEISLEDNGSSYSTYNIIEGNNIQTTAAKYGISEETSIDDYNVIQGDIINGPVTGNIYALGPHTTVAGNKTSSSTEGIFDIQAQANATQTALTVTQSGAGDIVDLTGNYLTSGKGIYMANSNSAFSGNALQFDLAQNQLQYAYYYNGSAYTNYTKEANSKGADYDLEYHGYPLLANASGDIFYFGNSTNFSALNFGLYNLATSATLVWEYCSALTAGACTSWTALTITDGTSGFTTNGKVTWTDPGSAWLTGNVNSLSAKWLRVRATALNGAPTAYYSTISIFTGKYLSLKNAGTEKLYINDQGDIYNQQFKKDIWSSLADIPAGVSYGSPNLLVYTGRDYIFALDGTNGTPHFYRYSISGNFWTAKTSPASLWNSQAFSGLVYTGGDYIYALRGNSSPMFSRYSISGDSWSNMTGEPNVVGSGSSLVYTGGDYIYALRGDTTTDFYRYSISGNSWTSMTSTPAAVQTGGALSYTGGDYIYAFGGNGTTNFYRYSISGNLWTSMASTSAGVGGGGALSYTGGDYIYAFGGNNTANFWRYSISTNSWISMASPPGTVWWGGSMVYTKDGFIYALRGFVSNAPTYYGTDFWRYSVGGDTGYDKTASGGLMLRGNINAESNVNFVSQPTTGDALSLTAATTGTGLTVTQSGTGNIVEFKNSSLTVFTISNTGDVTLIGDIYAAGGYKNSFNFMQPDAAAGQSAVSMNVLGLAGNTEYTLPYAGSVIGISVASNDARTAGTLTVDAAINGAVTGLQAQLDAVNTQYHSANQSVNTDAFAAGSRLEVKVTTSADWAPTTADIVVTVVIEY